jgi:hypothetical protein
METQPNDRRVPTVSRIFDDTLVELVYDAPSRKTALVVSHFGGLWNLEAEFRAGTGELLVPYGASNNLITSGCVLLPSKPVEYGHRHELVADIQAFLHRYVDLSPLFEAIAAHYVLLTWVYDRFGELPYLRLHGEYGTGKTRALTAIGSLCYKAFFASGASTVSPIFHILDAFGGTLILDEADLPFSEASAHLVKILNNGTVQGMPVLRTLQNRHKELNPTAFKVFGPKVIAMRERFQDTALESRFLTEETGTRPLRANIPLHLPSTLKSEALELRNRLLHFRLCEYFKINTDPTAAMAGVEPRLNQTALSLLSLVEAPLLRQEIQAALMAQYDEMLESRRDTPEALVVAAALKAFTKGNGREVSVGDITKEFNAAQQQDQGKAAASKWIGYILRTKLHIFTRKYNGVFVVPATEMPKLEALAHRYGIVPKESNTTAAT